VIGIASPRDLTPTLESGIAAAGTALAPDGFAGFAEAIMTTDKRPNVGVSRRLSR
jgi:N-acetylglutamate synthase/N-acetylornithine aminotransferase